VSRYFTRPRSAARSEWWETPWTDMEPARHIPTVSDHEPTDTGLLDAEGNTIWRSPETMGFIRDDTFATQSKEG
jgi:hypothetical protein